MIVIVIINTSKTSAIIPLINIIIFTIIITEIKPAQFTRGSNYTNGTVMT